MKYKLLITQHALPRVIRRNRRFIAAILASFAALSLANTITTTPGDVEIINQLEIPPGKSAVAIEITSELMGAAISVGQKIDIVSVSEEYASTIARSAEILRIGSSSARLGSKVTEVLIATSASEATKVATANQNGSLQVLLSSLN